MLKLKGIFAASLTPINSDFSINKNLFFKHCEWLLRQGIDGLAVFGTTGEASAFNVEEKIKSLQYLINSKISSNKLIPGTGHCSIRDTVKFSKKCADLNVRAVLVLPAFFYKGVSDEGIINYYKRVIEEVGDNKLHYILYNIPQVSGVKISFEVIDKLLKLYPDNVIGMKDSSGDLDNMLKVTKIFNGFSIFSGSDSLALKVCKHGGAGAITATSNISARLLSYIVNNYREKLNTDNFQELQKLQENIRQTLFTHEPISTLKAYMSIKFDNNEWNRVMPPLKKINEPNSHKTVIGLIELIKKMDELIPVT